MHLGGSLQKLDGTQDRAARKAPFNIVDSPRPSVTLNFRLSKVPT